MIVAIEVMVLFSLGIIIAIQSNREEDAIEISLSDWKATSCFTYDTDGWHIDETMVDPDLDPDRTICLYGPYAKLSRGTYSVSIEYECEYDQSCQIYANDIQDIYINGRAGRLSKNYKKTTYDFTLTEEIDNFEFVVDYNRQGYLWIKSIKIHRNSAELRSVFASIVLFSLGIYVWLYYGKRRRVLFLEISGIILLASLPLFVKGIYEGHDIVFHLMRIEGLAREVRRGVFPVKMSSLWMDGYGYPVSVFYGDFLLYIVVALRIMGFPVVAAYKLYVFLINIGTTVISYGCFKRIFKSEEVAVLAAFAYTTAGYRIVCIFVRAAVGEYSAMMFLPLIALAVYQFYTSASDEWKVIRRYAFVLAMGMTGVIGSHILSVEMVFVTLAILGVVCWKKTFKRNVLCGYFLAMVESLAFNLYFIVPLLDYYRNVEVCINAATDEVQAIQQKGAYIGQYFYFFQDIFGQGGNGIASRMSFTPGMPLMFVLIVAVMIWMKGKATKEIKILSAISAFVLFIASDLFPWNYLALHYKWGNLLSQVQFPWRYIGIAMILLTMLLGCICQLIKTDESGSRKFSILIISGCIIMAIFYASNYSNRVWPICYYDTAEVDTCAVMGMEYLRVGTDVSSLPGKLKQENMKEVSLLSRDGTYMELYCETSESEGIVEVPMLNYKGYKVWDENGKEYKITDGSNNVIQFTVPAGFAGNLKIDFFEPWYWKIAELISLVAIIFVGVGEFRNRTAHLLR